MFQLEEQLKAWRDDRLRSESLSEEDVEELECHLRDSIADLTASGLNAQEAFLVAKQRLGSSDQIDQEYRKVNGRFVWRHRAFWMLAGCVLFQLSSLATQTASSVARLFAGFVAADAAVVSLASLTSSVLCVGAIAVMLVRWLPNRSGTRAAKWLFDQGHALPLVGMIGVVLIGWSVQAVSQIVLARQMSVTELGRTALFQAYWNVPISILVPVSLLFVMLLVNPFRLSRNARLQSSTVS